MVFGFFVELVTVFYHAAKNGYLFGDNERTSYNTYGSKEESRDGVI